MVAAIETPADLERVELAAGQAALWWLGQSGFALRARGTTVLLDPFLAEHRERLHPPAFAPERGGGLAAILCTHEHIDHFDAETIPALAAASPDALIVVPAPIVGKVATLGIDPGRVVGAQPDEPFEVGGLTVHPLPALHGVDVADAYSYGKELSDGLYRYLGYLVESDGLRVYHAGDTLADEELEDRLARLGPQVMLLPVNGRDHYREAQNLVGNLTPREAVQLAAGAGAGLLVPMHFDMFAKNLGDPAHVVEYAARTEPDLAVLLPGRRRAFVCAAS
jgi:L-ascorbate metabolism protein UlaG (beta-lactamase superfamily)